MKGSFDLNEENNDRKWITNDEFWSDLSKRASKDMVNSPSHYTVGQTDVIDVIESAVSGSDDPIAAVLQGNVIKYILRLWFKGNELQDAKKAQWYLNRLIEKLEINNEQK